MKNAVETVDFGMVDSSEKAYETVKKFLRQTLTFCSAIWLHMRRRRYLRR
ncbi:MAG: hypothetical protein L6V93_06905 [Clostridiales bacterium]|nr:MAG: hypothetical protein L6V93_06905 [Clostridiales bacterium]